jgi:hypothetical protein
MKNIYNFTGSAELAHLNPVLVQAMEKLNAGKKLKSSERPSVGNKGIVRLMGWEYDFRSHMKLFVVKTVYNLSEVWAFNKTEAKAYKGEGRLNYIVEVPVR